MMHSDMPLIKDSIRRFFDQIFNYCDGKIEIRPLPGTQSFFETNDHSAIISLLNKYKRSNLYFGVGTRDGEGGKKENIIHLPAVWCDADFKDTPKEILAELLGKFPFRASIIVITGGGVHLYWLLKEPAEKSEIPIVEDINRRIANLLGGDMAATDGARILRIPGTNNWKYPAKVKLHKINQFKYELQDFLDVLPEVPIMKSTVASRGVEDIKAIYECTFINWCKQNVAKVPEPYWYALLSNIATIRPGGITLCHELSKNHPEYTPKETDQKILHALDSSGPHTCQYIKSIGFDCRKQCGVKSPVGLIHKKPGATFYVEQKFRPIYAESS